MGERQECSREGSAVITGHTSTYLGGNLGALFNIMWLFLDRGRKLDKTPSGTGKICSSEVAQLSELCGYLKCIG